MLKKNRLVSLIITFCFCFTFLAPAFISPPAAEASAYYTPVKAPTIATDTSQQTVDLGSVQVNFPDKRVLPEFNASEFKEDLSGLIMTSDLGKHPKVHELVYKLEKMDVLDILDLNVNIICKSLGIPAGNPACEQLKKNIELAGLGAMNNQNLWEYLTVNLPAGLEYSLNSLGDPVAGGTAYNITKLSKSNDLLVIGNRSSNTSWDFKIAHIVDEKEKDDPDAHFLLEFKNIKIDGAVGKIDATFHSPSASAILPFGTATIATITGGGQTTCVAKSIKEISDDGGAIDTFLVVENVKGTFNKGDMVELKLPTGFSWDNVSNTKVKGNWAFTGYGNKIALDPQTRLEAFKLYLKPTDPTNRTLVLLFTEKFIDSSKVHTSGRIAIGTGETKDYLKINVDNSASTGDVFVTVTSPNIKKFTDQDVLIAKYGKHESKLESKEVKQLVAGKDDQDIGAFYIKEDIPGTLVKGRTIYLDLPAGVKWYRLPDVRAESGINVAGEVSLVPNTNERKAKIVITSSSVTKNAAKLLVERGKVYVEPGYKGDIEIDISGSAGVKGKAKVAEVALGVEMTTSTVPNVVVGQQAQKVADIEIKENQRGLIRTGKNIVLGLDEGYKFYKQPEVTVTAGNLQIDNVKLSSDSSELKIEVRGDSYEPSSIKIADIYLDGFRYATTGSVKAKLVAAEGKEPDVTGSTALDRPYGRKVASNGVLEDDVEVEGVAEEAKIKKDNRKYSGKSAGEVIVANCITPAGAAGMNASFTIDSNIYIINGVSKVMDVAPYIKNERTYMPVRYVAYALGLTDDDIVWDEASQKVTLTKGDTVVEMTIGDKTLTINGEARSMDTAPEITNSRTMLPIRFVAEAFGAMVGWDPDTRTTVIN